MGAESSAFGPGYCDVCRSEPVTTVESFTHEYFVKGKTITLHEITVHRCGCGVSPEIWCMGPLLEMVQSDSAAVQSYRFDMGAMRWFRLAE